MKNLYSEKEIIWLKENYLKFGPKYCSEYLKRSYSSVRYKANQIGERFSKEQRQSSMVKAKREKSEKMIPIEQFYNIRTSIVSYFLGFMWADGCIVKKNNQIQLGISEKDQVDISNVMKNIGEWHLRKDEKTKSVKFEIGHYKLSKFLKENDYHLKSYVEPTKILSKIPKNLHYAFWHGFFDGDGCLCLFLEKHHSVISFGGQSSYQWDCLKNLLNLLQITKYKIEIWNKKNHNYSTLRFGKKQQVMHFLKYIYNANREYRFGLKRKHDIMLKFVDICEKSRYQRNIKFN